MGTLMKLDGLQAGRAIAALLVVAFHTNAFILPDRLYDGAGAGRIFNFGYAGVEFFFVLSGFIMVFVHQRDFSIPGRMPIFLRKRIVRIYPVYLVVYLGLTALYFMDQSRGPDHARDLDAILTSLILWPMPEPPVMQVAWTLQHEMLFYLIFSVLVLNFRLGVSVLVTWMGACLIVVFWRPLAYPWDFLLSAYNVLFLFGIAAALGFHRLTQAQAWVWLMIGSIAFVGVGASEVLGFVNWDKSLRTWCYGLSAAVAVTGLAAGAVSPPKWLSFLGDASYAIYLVHLPAMTVGVVFAKAVGAPWDLPPLAIMLGLLIYASIAGVIVHLVVERPLARLTQPHQKKP